MKNKEIAGLFDRIADALEIKGEVAFKVISYRKAARILDDMTEDIAVVAGENRLQSIPGIGSGIAAKIVEYLKTGEMKKVREALEGIPEGLIELLNIQNVGGKTVHLIQKELGVRNLPDLKRVIADGSMAKLYGMGDKRVDNISRGIEAFERAQERISIYEAKALADAVTDYLRSGPPLGRISAAGSLRRMKETVGDIDILATGKNGADIIRFFAGFPKTLRVLAEGETKGSIVVQTESGERQVDLRIVAASEYGAALQYFTGSKDHNIKLRGLAKNKGLKISEYGLFRGEKKLAGAEEEEIYKALGMPWIPPEMREDRGEIELAIENKLPAIVDYADVKGDLHVHTKASDGNLEIREIVDLARKLGYQYIAVCDHSQAAKYAGGLTPERLSSQAGEIDRLNRGFKGFYILKGIEVDILADGRLDFPDEVLKRLDFVVAAIHSGFRKNVTERIVKALENPWVKVIAHPSGRLISGREGYDVDLEKVFAAAQKHQKSLELNAYYDRLDLDEFNLKKAKERGIPISIGTDTHYAHGLRMMTFGVGIARRAWLSRKDILNCRNLRELVPGKPRGR